MVFALDIIVEFNSAFYDNIFKLVDDRKAIASNYLQGMFFLDFIAIIPVDFLFESSEQNTQDMNQMIRITKLNKLQKLIKLTRLVKMLKVLKHNNSILKLTGLFRLGNGFERLFMFILCSMLVCHMFTCLWVFFGQLESKDNTSWI